MAEQSELALYETKFQNRFTEEDPVFMAYLQKQSPSPPIVDNWASRSRRNFHDRNTSRLSNTSRVREAVRRRKSLARLRKHYQPPLQETQTSDLPGPEAQIESRLAGLAEEDPSGRATNPAREDPRWEAEMRDGEEGMRDGEEEEMRDGEGAEMRDGEKGAEMRDGEEEGMRDGDKGAGLRDGEETEMRDGEKEAGMRDGEEEGMRDGEKGVGAVGTAGKLNTSQPQPYS
ncbi:hypothetical protein Bbelb_415730 [Branchiostoma belcheri]|nr:hypothetical protein Bbelb_415730 [Branchiostoma belcheri]